MSIFGLYIHWPFCLSKCPYCDFNSHVREQINSHRWEQALLKELRTIATLFAPEDRKLQTIFFGGGTPSLMAPETVAALIQEARTLWPCVGPLEITLEANPTSVEAKKFEGFQKAGVNRLSLGIQSFQEEALRFLGRQHSATQGREAIYLAQQMFPRFSFDLIYARPHQTLGSWQAELEEALTVAKGHLSLYQLTYEPGTPFYTRFQRGELTYPSEEEGIAFYQLTQTLTEQKGLNAYEVSNYARPGDESQHNLIYWRGFPYVGIGPGAHGRLLKDQQIWATRTHRAPEIWLERVEASGHGLVEQQPLSHRDLFLERILMGLRLTEGIPLARLARETTRPLHDWVPVERLTALAQEKLIEITTQTLRLTEQGRLRLNQIISYLTAFA